MFNQQKRRANEDNEKVIGTQTSESFKVYSKLTDKKTFNLSMILLYVLLTSLLLSSALIFASSIKAAYFTDSSKKPHTESESNINTIKSSYQKNGSIKVETVTQEVAGLFGIPTGVKIIELNNEDPFFKGLRVNDIIVEVSGRKISSIEDMGFVDDNLTSDSFIIYTVYRNGAYKTIDPFDSSLQ